MSSFRKIAVAFLLAASAAVIAGALLAEENTPPARPEAPSLTITKTPLGIATQSRRYSPDLRHVACSMSAADGQYILRDGGESKHYEEITLIGFSADSKRLACSARSEDKYFMVVDGREGKQYDRLGPFLFSPDSARVVYSGMSVESGKQWCVVADGVRGNWYRAVGNLVYSPDSKHLAYITGQGLGGMPEPIVQGSGVIVIDGKEMRQFDSAHSVVFSPDSAHWACRIKVGNSSLVVMDGVDGKAYSGVSDPVFSPDSKHMAYIGKAGGKYCVVLDGVEGKWYDRVGLFVIHGLRDLLCGDSKTLVFSPDSQHLAYTAQDEGGFFIVKDGVEEKKYKVNSPSAPPLPILTPVFSPDSKHVAYGVNMSDGPSFAVLDAVEQAANYSEIKYITFSPDSSRLAYWANTPEGWCVVVDGVEGKTYSNPYYAPITPRMDPMESVSIAFSPDSKRVIYLAQNGMSRCIVIVDGVESKEYVRIFDLVMTSDSKHIAYRAGLGQRAIWVLDGQEVIVRDLNAMTGLTFDSPTKCHGIMGGNAAFLIEIEIKP